MSTYNHPRPGVSQYIANLNTIQSDADLSAQNEFDITSDGLDFLNTEFFDFDASAFDPNNNFAQHAASAQHAAAPAANGEGFQYGEFASYPAAQFSQSPSSMTQSPSAIQYPQDFAGAVTGDKRTASAAQLQPVGELEDSSRHAAEEDKRRRNTAASARFRVSALESKVQQLEMENKWLKGLITEKSDAKGMAEKFQKYIKEKQVESKTDKRNDGVGTKAEIEA
ncbi:hypothetical protein AMS68_002905 [Peltaster fructicola]|uniref:BZIP domain-containing protein n=1 Tax=Peltaster fructicola TaxID=286661 RepID=A0A6H0XRY6_9PEZI|nr:hypothetical protein AMS68_002905 [Peltaster fructicola]